MTTPTPPAELATFGHHPDPAIDFCVEVEDIEGEIANRAAGLSPLFDLNERIERAMQFKVGGDAQAVVAKVALRAIDAAFRAGRAALAVPAGCLAEVQPIPEQPQSEQPQDHLAVNGRGDVRGDAGWDTRTCTCHPDDNPPKPCPRKFALSDCRAAAASQEQAPTLPRSLLAAIGKYGMARTDGVTTMELIHRWELLIDGIKSYAAAVRDGLSS